jgi:hypothetical protein
MQDLSHLTALQQGLSHERARLAAATNASEIAQRTVWVGQYEKEIAAEFKFLGIDPTIPAEIAEMTDEELLAELAA